MQHFWVAVSMVFFMAATIFTLLKLSGDTSFHIINANFGDLRMQIPAILVREYCITMAIVIFCLKVKKSEEWSFVICTAMVLFDRRKI